VYNLLLNLPLSITFWKIPDAVHTVVCAPDDGWWYHTEHVEQFPDKINSVQFITKFNSIHYNVKNTRCCIHTVVCAPDDGWWYHTEHVEQFPDKINCVQFITKFNSVHYIVKNTRCCTYSCMRSWWWVVVPHGTCRTVSR